MGEWHSLSLPKHSQIHRPLLPFADLVNWMRRVRPAAYEQTVRRYLLAAQAIYKHEIDAFFKKAISFELKRIAESNGGGQQRKTSSGLMRGVDSFAALGRNSSAQFDRSANDSALMMLDESAAIDQAEQLARLAETLLAEFDPVVCAEQKFVVRFLHIQQEAPNLENVSVILTGWSDGFGGQVSNLQTAEKRAERAYAEQIRMTMRTIFAELDEQFERFIRAVFETENSWAFE